MNQKTCFLYAINQMADINFTFYVDLIKVKKKVISEFKNYC